LASADEVTNADLPSPHTKAQRRKLDHGCSKLKMAATHGAATFYTAGAKEYRGLVSTSAHHFFWSPGLAA
jgi:hypothetical protein